MIADLKKIWAVFTPVERRRATWMLGLVVLMAAAETLGVLSIMPFLSVLGRPAVIHENPLLQAAYEWLDFGGQRNFILALGVASIAVVIASSLFKTVTLHLVNRFVHLERHSISSRLLSGYLRQPYEFFLGHNSADLSKNILSETDQMLFNLVQPLAQMFAQGAVILAMGGLIIWYDPWMALVILFGVASLYGAIYGVVRKRLVRTGMERMHANRDRYQASNEVLGGIKDVKITHSAAAYMERFERASRLYSRHQATNDTLSQTPLYLVEAVGYSGLILIALALLLRTDDVAHVLPALGLYGFAAYRMLPAAQIVYRGFAKLKFSSPALDVIHRDLALPFVAEPKAEGMLVPRQEIRLENVCFAYPAAPERRVLDDFSLVIPANGSVGIVGKSGAGKSTVMDLLLGLLSPQAGTLSVDGVPITGANVANWQRAIGYVPQHIYLTDASVAENIAFGVKKGSIDMRAVERAARAAQIHDFIIGELPDGYATFVGERGIRLSGGQRQRIGIARALYHDPAVLFFDEATSALDTETELALARAISILASRKTIVIIAHRDISLQSCGSIIRVDAGDSNGS
ncbi:ABC transporter ATP-binding protein [Stenotrophomonas daejeonensis]|uniref:ABC transporter ATP-binding protein n=1 Tax=Stenotrophomonas daejeonensis TaxID=659018 RepID=A0A0R0DZV7_9GAMM|nr:ABC transporter ATP-binding protein [Stenotrophomonas daejeonensis]KRG87705.1 ABC transporter ATP-binding protein [Stenotrophomonas daejeonensis]